MTDLETPYRIEPSIVADVRGELLDILTELPAAASALTGRLHPKTAANLADLVRVMNCYYSNLIEGHNTRPRDIERALANDLDVDEPRRNLQLEAGNISGYSKRLIADLLRECYPILLPKILFVICTANFIVMLRKPCCKLQEGAGSSSWCRVS